jgi:hypothetical protein
MSLTQPLPTPERIVERDGQVHTGWFERPFVVANLGDADPFAGGSGGGIGRLLGGVTGRSLRALRLKQWHYTSVVTDRVLFACAVVDIGYVGNAFAYVVDRATGRTFEYATLTPAAAGITIASNSIDGTTSIRFPGFGAIALHNDSARGTRRIECDLEGRAGGKPSLRASIAIRDEGREPAPIVTVEESEPRCWLYTHKCYGLEAEGSIDAGSISEAFALGEGLAGLDYNRGYRPRETYWNWAAAAGRSACGTRIGFNLTTSVRPGEAHSSGAPDSGDCALWLGPERIKIPRVRFEYDARALMSDWRVRDDEGLVDLVFSPAGERAEDVNAGLVVSRFHQPYGTFRGTLRNRNGRTFALTDVYGVVEQHFARW